MCVVIMEWDCTVSYSVAENLTMVKWRPTEIITPVSLGQQGEMWTEHEVDELILINQAVSWEVTDGMEVERLWMRGPDFYVTEFLNCFQNGDNCISVLWNCVETAIFPWNKWATSNVVMTSHVIFMTQGTLFIDHISYKPKRSLFQVAVCCCVSS